MHFDPGSRVDYNELERVFTEYLAHNNKSSRFSLFSTLMMQLPNYGDINMEHDMDDKGNVLSINVTGIKLKKVGTI